MVATIQRGRHASKTKSSSGGNVGRKRREADLKTYSGRVAARLRALREKEGWSVDETVQRLGRAGLAVEAPSYYQWESGHNAISLEHLPALASIFGKTVRAFLPAE